MDGSDRGLLAHLPASPRHRILLAVGVLLLVVRAVLPYALRPILVSRVDEALVGHVELGDLDLSLLRGGVTLHDFSLHTDERPSQTPALFEAKRLWTQISWLALLFRTIEVEELELEGFHVHLERFDDGLLLPRPIPSETPDERESASTPESSAFTWSVAADAVAFRTGRIELVDHTVRGEPERFALGIQDLTARELAIRSDPADDEPGRVAIEAKLDEGSVSLSAWIEQSDAGLDVRSTLVLTDLPIEKLRAYLPMFGWDALAGRLDASLEHRFVTGGAHELKGKASLEGVVVGVPRFSEPALAWKNLELVVDRVDLAGRHAEIASITSTGARVLVDPRAESPLVLLAPPEPKPEDAARPTPTEAPRAADAPGATAEAVTDAANRPPPAVATEPAAKDAAWSWRVNQALVTDAVVDLRGAKEPVLLRLDAAAGSLSSEPATGTPIALEIAARPGRIDLEGVLTPAPIAFEGKLSVRDLELAPLVAQVDVPALPWLQAGRLRADLLIAVAGDLRAAGTLGLAGLELGEATTARDFAVAWKDLELALSGFALPGLTGPVAPAAQRKIDVKLARLRLVEPRFVLTRDAHGLVLPSLAPGGDAESIRSATREPPPSVTAANEREAAPEQTDRTSTPTAVSLSIADARIEHARASLADRSVEPEYRGRIESLDLHATGIRWPQNEVDFVDLKMVGLRGARLTLQGAIRPGKSRLEGKLVELPLEQFNPYLAARGYGVRNGALSLDSTARFEAERFKTESRIVMSALDVGGGAGEAAFQKNFGVSLSIAVGLLKDLDGKIALAVPVAGKRDEIRLGLRQIVGQALRKALVGALTSPLKLLGAVTRGDRVEGLAPLPVVFTPGESEPSTAAEGRIEEIARLLASAPSIGLALTGQSSGDDRRILSERALLVELEAGRGLRALSALGEIATRRAVRLHLAARLAGDEPPPLSAEGARWLESHLAAAAPPIDQLEALANERANRVRAALTSEHGIAERRLVVTPPVVEPPAPEPGVAIAVTAVASDIGP